MPTRLSRPVLCAVLVIAVLAVFHRTAFNDFVGYDDPGYVTRNGEVTRGLSLSGVSWAFRSTAQSNWHPVTWLSHMLDVQLFGLVPAYHHLVSVAIHATSAVLLFLLLLGMTSEAGRSLTVAALFALHPLHVESVAWVAERKDVVSGLFWHLTLLAYVAYARRPGPGRYLATVLSFAVGLMAKPMLVTLPVVLLLLDWWPLGRMRGRSSGGSARSRLIVEKLPFLALSVVSSVATLYAQHHGGSLVDLSGAPLGLRIANAFGAIASYLGKAFWPRDLAVLYPLVTPVPIWLVAAGAAAVLACSAAAIILAPRVPYLVTGWFWFLVTLVPVLGLVQVGAQSMADRYTYIPLTGVLLIVVWGGADLLRTVVTGRVVAVVASAAVAAAALGSFIQVGYWKDSLTLYRHALDVTRRNALMVNNYAAALDEAGRPDEAISVVERAMVSESIGSSSYLYLVLNTYASALNNVGRTQEAIPMLERAIELKPSYATSYYSLGRILHTRLNDVQTAAALYERAIELRPDYLEAHVNLGGALNRAGQYERGLVVLERARALGSTGSPELYFNLGVSYASLGRTPEALGEVELLRGANPAMAQRLLDYVTQRTADSQR